MIVNRTSTVPALIVPDERSWTMWGHDVAAAGFTPAASAEAAAAVLAPAELPEPLADALVELIRMIPGRPRVVTLASPLTGAPVTELVARAAEEPGDGDGTDHEDMSGHDMSGHDHGGGDDDEGDEGDEGDEPWANNMMPIHGTPSGDGLVMEDVDVALGPLGSPLPGGLVVELGLDGEVVCRCRLTRTLATAPGSPWRPPDPLAAAAWTAAHAHATQPPDALTEAVRRRHVVAGETERALSHSVSLRELGRALGWQELVDAAGRSVGACVRARACDDGAPAALRAVEDLHRLLDGSRRLRFRARRRAVVHRERLQGVPGPVARACGVPVDARVGDELYAALGFEVVTLDAGDAEARTLLRAAEACVALRLAITAARDRGSDEEPTSTPVSGAVEGPRGPVRIAASADGLAASTPGADRLLAGAQHAVTGETYARALAGLVSFDLSAWRVAA